jgi:L-ribulose-5-phosphate 3-epimerase
MQTAVCQWCYPASVSTFDAMATARECGFDGFEVATGISSYLTLDSSAATLAEIRKHAEALGLSLTGAATGIGWQHPLTSNNRARRDKGCELTTRATEITAELGLETLLIVPGMVNAETNYNDAFRNGVASIQSILPRAEGLGVSLAVENVWNNFLLNPEELRQFVDQCGSARAGVYLDIGNVLLYGYLEKWIQTLKSRIFGVHINDFKKGMSKGNGKGFVMPGEGDVDWPHVLMALRSVGYTGSLTIEYEPQAGAVGTRLRQALSRLRLIQTLKA